MARPLRIQYPSDAYHVMACGSHGEPVFADDPDRKLFLETLGEACAKAGWRIHAYTRVSRAVGKVKREPDRRQKR